MITSEDIHKTALSFIGLDASPADRAPDNLACVETVCDIITAAGGSIPTLLSTITLKQFLRTSSDWEETESPERGDVILCVTGEGNTRVISNGHTGIVLDDRKIGSNDSRSGKFQVNYTIESWKQHWNKVGSYPVYFYSLKKPVPVVETPVVIPPLVPDPADTPVVVLEKQNLWRELNLITLIVSLWKKLTLQES